MVGFVVDAIDRPRGTADPRFIIFLGRSGHRARRSFAHPAMRASVRGGAPRAARAPPAARGRQLTWPPAGTAGTRGRGLRGSRVLLVQQQRPHPWRRRRARSRRQRTWTAAGCDVWSRGPGARAPRPCTAAGAASRGALGCTERRRRGCRAPFGGARRPPRGRAGPRDGTRRNRGVAFAMSANHGGSCAYRLCKRPAPPRPHEACRQPLAYRATRASSSRLNGRASPSRASPPPSARPLRRQRKRKRGGHGGGARPDPRVSRCAFAYDAS